VGDPWITLLDDQAAIHSLESEGRRDLPQILLGSLWYITLVLFVSFILGFSCCPDFGIYAPYFTITMEGLDVFFYVG